jgi:hypothetical protein
VDRKSFWDASVAWRANKITREQVNDIVRPYREFVNTFESAK